MKDKKFEVQENDIKQQMPTKGEEKAALKFVDEGT